MDFRTNDRNYYYGILSVSQQSQSTDANTSTLAYSLTLYAGNTWFSGYTIGYRVKVDGAQVAYHDNYGNQTSMSRNSSKLVCSGTTTVQHDDDGQKTVAVEAEIWTDSSSGLPVYLSCSGSMTLDQILRESSIAATDANIGAATMIVVARRKESYTHSIAFAFGSLSGYLLADGSISSTEAKLTATQIGWTLPASFYAQIPAAKSGTVKLTCRTYNGDKQVGTARTATFRATAAEEECAPSVSGAVEDTNAATIALTGDASKLVRFCSTALCTITAAAKNGAALASKSIAGEAVEGSSRAISAVELDSFVFAAADSRGYTTSLTVQAEIVPYVKLTAYAEAERVDTASGKVRLTVSGSVFGGSFGATGNALTVKYRLDHAVGWTDIPAAIADNAYTAEVMLYNVTYNAAHTLEVSVADKLTTVPLTGEIKRGIPVFDWGAEDMELHIPVVAPAASLALTGGTDVAGYVRIAAIKITGQQVNTPISLVVSRKADNTLHQIVMRFAAADSTDPGLELLTATGDMAVFARRTAAGVWDVYAAKTGAGDVLAVLDLRYNLAYLQDRLTIDINSDGYLEAMPSGAVTAAQNASMSFPGVDSSFRLGRDNAAVRVKNPNGAIGYTPALSVKCDSSSWEVAGYDDSLYITNFADSDYEAGTNTPKKYYIFDKDALWHLQGWTLVANGSLTSGATLSGTAAPGAYKTIHVLFGEALSGGNYYTEFACAFSDDYWNVYLPAAGDYYRAQITISGSTVSVKMLSSVTRQCYIYASI